MKKTAYAMCLNMALMATATVGQAVPQLLNYQGSLTDAAGAPLPTAAYDLTFSVYAAPCGANPCNDTPVWGPATISADVVRGFFNVVLSTDGEGDPITTAFRSANRYVEIAVNGAAPILPRQQILSTPYAVQAENGVSVGTLLPFAGSTPPAGYLACDGSEVSRTEYAALFAVIGTAWGEGDATTTFNLPDLRGRFLRGQDAGAGLDLDAASRSAANPGGATGDAVGSVEGDRVRDHRHKWGRTTSGGWSGDLYSYTQAGAEVRIADGTEDQNSVADGSSDDWYTKWIGVAALYTAPDPLIEDATGETRPVNAGVLYIIRY